MMLWEHPSDHESFLDNPLTGERIACVFKEKDLRSGEDVWFPYTWGMRRDKQRSVNAAKALVEQSLDLWAVLVGHQSRVIRCSGAASSFFESRWFSSDRALYRRKVLFGTREEAEAYLATVVLSQ